LDQDFLSDNTGNMLLETGGVFKHKSVFWTESIKGNDIKNYRSTLKLP